MNTQIKPRIVYIEDAPNWLEVLGEMFQNGFDPSRTQFEPRADCSLLKREIAGEASLARAYILDNEIENDYGAKLAPQIIDVARARGEQVTVVSLLCSSIPSARKEFGQLLDEREIPL